MNYDLRKQFKNLDKRTKDETQMKGKKCWRQVKQINRKQRNDRERCRTQKTFLKNINKIDKSLPWLINIKKENRSISDISNDAFNTYIMLIADMNSKTEET